MSHPIPSISLKTTPTEANAVNSPMQRTASATATPTGHRPATPRGQLWRLGVSMLGLIGLMGGASGCATAVSLKVLEPASVFVPPHVQTIAVIDRSQANSTGGALLATLEGALTGEQIGLDQEGRQQAVGAAVSGLAGSPRFRVIQPILDRNSSESDLFDSLLSPGAAQRICARNGCDAIVALEVFDSDLTVYDKEVMTEYTDDQGKKHNKRQHEANMDGRVIATWRLYDTRQGIVLDSKDHSNDNHWAVTEDSFQEAAQKLPDQGSWVTATARDFGADYSRRIAPTYVYVERQYYSSFDDRLKAARDRVVVNDWVGAVGIWQGMQNDPNPKVASKAIYNLAIAKEVEGDLDGALAFAKQSCIVKSRGRCRDYVYLLEDRIRKREQLRQQMAPPPVAAPPAAKPTPPPPRGKKH